MRCVKCGKIINETVNVCSCGKDLRDIKVNLGNFIEPNREFSWFSNVFSSQESQSEGPSSAFSGIGDISDLFKDTSDDTSYLKPTQKENIFDDKADNKNPEDLSDIKNIPNEKELEEALKNLKF